MNNSKIRKQIQELKIHIDRVEEWAIQANNMVYSIEEKLMDMDDRKIIEPFLDWKRYQEMETNTNIKTFSL